MLAHLKHGNSLHGVASFRLIALSGCVGKLLERIILSRLELYSNITIYFWNVYLHSNLVDVQWTSYSF